MQSVLRYRILAEECILLITQDDFSLNLLLVILISATLLKQWINVNVSFEISANNSANKFRIFPVKLPKTIN